jgi:hypothetical protein
MVVGERQGFVYHRTQSLGTSTVFSSFFLLEDALPVFRHGYGTQCSTGFYM